MFNTLKKLMAADIKFCNKLIIFFLLPSFIIFSSCDKKEDVKSIYLNSLQKTENLKKNSLMMKNWFKKDFENDHIPGISLEKAYRNLLKDKESFGCTIALIDMAVDIKHKSLENIIWINEDEILNNIDDDHNGYVDDINGWNFIGNDKLENIKFSNYEYTRVIRKYHHQFYQRTKEDISPEELDHYELYNAALEAHEKRKKYSLDEKEYIARVEHKFINASEIIFQHTGGKPDLLTLDSIKGQYSDNSDITEAVDYILKNEITKEWIDDYKLKTYERINKLLNVEYNDRTILNEDPNDINDSIYGNNFVNNNINFFEHGTQMAGGISSIVQSGNIEANINIMPIAISSYGDENDKDIALAIRYAVNNGAKVINMSFSKEFSIHPEWIMDAIQYAEKNDVLIIASAGNDNKDINEIISYPNDSMDGKNSLVSNFLRVGSTSIFLNKKFKSSFSNYGENQVDVFAPGQEIYTATLNDTYNYISGTSISTVITSSLAGLLFSYYPDLSAPQVKKIIMQSGVGYDIEVDISERKSFFKKTKLFKSLSKSGKVINIHNAFLLAESIINKREK